MRRDPCPVRHPELGPCLKLAHDASRADDPHEYDPAARLAHLQGRTVAATQAKQRGRRVHGWAFRDHTDEEVAGIRHFLETGDAARLPDRYVEL